MSCNLAFWVGPPPASDRAASEEFEALYTRHVESEEPSDPHPTLLAFIADITSTYPDLADLPDDDVDDSPWSDGPLTGNVAGPLLYLGVVWSRAEEMVTFLAARARKFELVMFDPQAGALVQASLSDGAP